MPFTQRIATSARQRRWVSVSVLLGLAVSPVANAQVPPPNPNGPKANWALFNQFGTAALRNMTFSTTITPRWIGETDSMFYSWRDTKGDRWYLVNAALKTKKPLFDHTKLAAQLSVHKKRAVEAYNLSEQFTVLNITKDHKHLRFAVDSTRYNWNIAAETLTVVGKYRGAQDSLMLKDEEVDQTLGGGGGGGRGGGGGGNAAGGGRGGRGPDPNAVRNWSPDSSAYVFARNHNLYLVNKDKGDTVQITKEGIDKFSLANGGGRGGGAGQDSTQNDNNQNDTQNAAAAAARPSRPNLTWSQDSKAFHITRTDTRGVKNMWVVRSLTEPRPTLLEYQYGMPGEDSIPKPELWTYIRGEAGAKKAPIEKWRDQRIVASGSVGVGVGGRGGAPPGPNAPQQGYWMGKTGTTMRIVRRDRLQRNMEFVELDVATGQSKVLVSDSKGDWGSLEPQGPVYVKTGGDFIWFSERDGWGHYYLYDYNGKLKRQLTTGEWRSDAVIAVDSVRQMAWIRGEGKEPGENLYNQHLYRISLIDGSTTLLDAGNANHNSTVSKNQKWVVDQYSRVDTVPRVALRDGTTGKFVMDLETADLTRLKEAGWRFAETFQVLAADGVTPIFGNMWKPFDFDSTKKYPIIAHVYPGPQTESVNGAFSPQGGPQQLAQLGFIVVQIGNRGGTPARSSAYQDFGYFDLRDYALADKKTGIEQLAARYKFIDIDRVGIYGHSGGGFLTAAALMLPPYNDFFKVGVSESGNHDNNIYNTNWSEQYHGLKWVAASDTARLTAEARSKGRIPEFTAGAAVATAELGGRGGRGGNGGQGGNNTFNLGGRNGGGGGGTNAGSAGAGAGGSDSTNAAAGAAGGRPGAKPDSVFWIYVPTNIDIAANLKGKLMLSTGDEDNNVSPSNTIRLVNALIKSGKRFDYMIYPGQAHSFGPMAPYAFQLQAEYFAEFLLGDREFRNSADFNYHPPNR
ncbi:MAG: DPP IV N-terminal domain-containing protein [Gemmatimonas sp.]